MYYDIYILGYLMQRPHYGYEIKKRMTEAISACTTISNNSLYPILKKYEKAGATQKHVEAHEGTPSRLVYSITDVGRQMFVDALWHFNDALISNREDFCVYLHFFDYLSPDARRRVLTLRQVYIDHSRAIIESRQPVEAFIPASPDLTAYHLTLLGAEQRLIDTFKPRIDAPCKITANGTLIP